MSGIDNPLSLEKFPLSDRERMMWYLYTLYLPPKSKLHKNNLMLKKFRLQMCRSITQSDLDKLITNLATFEQNYIGDLNASIEEENNKQ